MVPSRTVFFYTISSHIHCTIHTVLLTHSVLCHRFSHCLTFSHIHTFLQPKYPDIKCSFSVAPSRSIVALSRTIFAPSHTIIALTTTVSPSVLHRLVP